MTKPRFSFHTIFAREPSGLAGVSRSVIGDHDTPSADSVVLPASTPSFLIDEDPFADLSHGLCSQRNLPEDSPLQSLSSTSAIVHLPPRTSVLVGSTQARPAFKRPAISSRPSLPSLSTLSHMKIGASFPQVRNGHVGAGLPAEPWDLVRVTSGSPISANDTNSITAIPTPSSCEPTSPLTRTDESKAISTSPSDNPMTLSIAPHSVPPLRPITKLRTTSASVRFFDAPPSPNKEHTPAEKFELDVDGGMSRTSGLLSNFRVAKFISIRNAPNSGPKDNSDRLPIPTLTSNKHRHLASSTLRRATPRSP
ncbi:hypothetical protein C8F01DRAFT_519061 [Mycena amicta]|nr:hypothetical protein C8F01DRAFT_519061 [Mycena amicta]